MPPELTTRAAALARQGCTLREIAHALGCAEVTVSRLLAPHGGIHALRRAGQADTWYTANEASALLSIARTTLQAALRAGAISADRTKPQLTAAGRLARVRHGNYHGLWRISRAALCDFLRDRSYWMAYSPRAIADAELRRLAEAVQRDAQGRWVKLRSVAGCGHSTYSAWRKAGWPGPGWEVIRRGQTDWLWLPEGSAPPDGLPLLTPAARRLPPRRAVCSECGVTYLCPRTSRKRRTCGAPPCRHQALSRAGAKGRGKPKTRRAA